MATGDWTEEQAGRTIRPAAPWQAAGEYEDIRYETADGIAKITIDRPEVRNAFRPQTVVELSQAFERAREDTGVGVIVLTGEGPLAFCSGGDQRVRGDSGYLAEDEAGRSGVGRFHVTDLHLQMRRLPKPIVAMVAGYAIGGGHVLHVLCDLTIAADNAPLRPDGAEGRQLRRRLRRRRRSPPRWARRRPRRSGSSAGSTRRRRRSRWAW